MCVCVCVCARPRVLHICARMCSYARVCANARACLPVCPSVYHRGTARAYGNSRYGQGQAQIWLSSVSCVGVEPEIGQCGFSMQTGNCDHTHDVGVSCSAGLLPVWVVCVGDDGYGGGAQVRSVTTIIAVAFRASKTTTSVLLLLQQQQLQQYYYYYCCCCCCCCCCY